MTQFDTLNYTIDNRVACIELNRPETRNALNQICRLELLNLLRHANSDASVRAILLTGAGEGFCAGADLTEVNPSSLKDGQVTRLLEDEFNPLIETITGANKPYIAAINGVAAGFGASLALACDLVVMANGAQIYSAFGRIGLIADGGLHKLLCDYLGPKKAYEVIVLSKKLSATQCEQYGIANRVVAEEELIAQAKILANQVAQAAPLSVKYSKALLQQTNALSVMQVAYEEARFQHDCVRSADFREGIQAFFDKREPTFRGE